MIGETDSSELYAYKKGGYPAGFESGVAQMCNAAFDHNPLTKTVDMRQLLCYNRQGQKGMDNHRWPVLRPIEPFGL